jgi:hypothetical protein
MTTLPDLRLLCHPFRTVRRRAHAALQVEFLEDRRLLAAPAGLAAYGQMALRFEANAGQTDASVRFLARGPGYGLFLTPAEAVLHLHKPQADGPVAQTPEPADTLRLRLVGANPDPALVGLDELPTRSNYLQGNDPARWHTDVANYGQVAYRAVYPGIDLVYYGSQEQLEYDFVVAPGADPSAIRLAFAGARGMALDGQGNLVLHTTGGDVVEEAPVLYQDGAGGRQAVPGHYVMDGSGGVGFAVGTYDHSRPLVIDPILSYSTYLGGSGDDAGFGIAVDGAGNAYVTGRTDSTDFHTADPAQPANAGGNADAFVAKLNAAGSALVYATYLGGSGDDLATGIALDGAGNAYVFGQTSSIDFPTVNALQPASGGGGFYDAFVAKLNAAGSALVYSTYLGGSRDDQAGLGIAVDGAGNAYVSGFTTSTNFPMKNALQPTYGGGAHDAFVAKLNAAGSALVYSTYLGGTGEDGGFAIAVNGAGNAYVTGYTISSNFPTKNPLQPALIGGGAADAFVAKLSTTGNALVYSTYLGGGAEDAGLSIDVDGAGNAYLTGETQSSDFPTKNPLQFASGGGQDAFVAKLNTAGSALVYSTYLGGSGDDLGYGIVVDGTGSVFLTGQTASANFPTKNPLQPASGGGDDAFVVKLNAAGSALVYATYLGGHSLEEGMGIAVDSAGNAYVSGRTSSTDFPTRNPLKPALGDLEDAFVAKIATTPLTLFPSTLTAVAAAPFTAPLALLIDNRSPAEADRFTAFVAWGDGSSSVASLVPLAGGLSVVGDHTYAHEGSFPITITAQGSDGNAITASLTAVVADAPLTAVGRTLAGVEGAATSGVVASFEDADPQGFAGQYTAMIDWGDSSSSPGTISANGGGFDVAGTHAYPVHGNFTLTVTITDPGGATAVAHGTAAIGFTALVGHPRALSVFGNLNFTGTVATFDDPDPRTNPARYLATIFWPDDHSTSAGTVSGSNPFTVSGSHTFSSFAGTLTLKVVVTDLDSPGRAVTILSRVADPPAVVMHRAYVGQLYETLLGRPADDPGLTFWAGLLDSGAANAWVAGQFLASPEYKQREVRQLYAGYLHRAADTAGLGAFTSFLLAGGSIEQAQALLVGSVEYLEQRGGGTADGFVSALYQDALGRPADPAGRAAFENALGQGLSARQAAALLFGSAEYRRHQVQGWYQTLLHRDADPGGLALFTGALGDGVTDEEVLAALAGSAEYFHAVNLPDSL